MSGREGEREIRGAVAEAGIRRGQSCATDARTAVREFHAAVAQFDMALVVFFCSSLYDLDALADEMSRLFAGVQVVGCTTAGEFGPGSCLDHSLVGASFPASDFTAVSTWIEGLRQFEMSKGRDCGEELLLRLSKRAPDADAANSFALLLIDGLSMREEPVARALQSGLREIQLVGGSAGDGLRFGKTLVYAEGRFHADSAVAVVVHSALPFRIFKTQHFVPTDQRMVVTAAEAERRIVREIDGWPAVEAYARLVGAPADSLDPMSFAASPVVVLIDGTNYVRSIQKANPDGSLSFFCAIEEGLVLRVARGVDLIENLEHALMRLEAEVGPPQLVIACDCILRKLEIEQRGLRERVGEILKSHNVIGFNSYGEQFRGVHVNQTLTGVAIGSRKGSA